jgi:hypothetical protein
MRDHRLLRISLRCAAIALFVVPALGTSCVGPAVYVFRRYPISGSVGSADTLPLTLSVRGHSFSRPESKRRPLSRDPARPNCAGFQVYRIDRVPAGLSRDDLSTMPPYEFELLMHRGATPALVVFYRYTLPERTLDPSTPDGAAQVAQTARRVAVMDSAADEVARTVVTHAGMTVRAVTDTMRTQSIEAMRDRCRAELAGA